MRRAKSIDELYEEVRDHDLVITNDAALATALNGRIDVPRIGGFAYTPRHIAGNEAVPIFGAGILSDLKIISEIANETGYGLKHIHSELENIRNIRRYKKDVRKYLYSRSSREIYDSFTGLRTMEKLMDSYLPEDRPLLSGMKVAVIGIEFFDDLDKHFIPVEHDEIDIFAKGDHDICTIHEIGNDRQIAENIVSLIDRSRAEDTAIVLDTSGPIADAVRAAMYRMDIPFRNTMSVKDLSQVRDYLQFLTLSLSYETLRVRHVRELFSGYGGSFRQREDEYLLHKIESHLDNRTKELADVMRNIRNITFLDVCDAVVRDVHRPQVRMLIDDMRMRDAKITSRLVNELSYAVNNIDDLRHNEEIPDNEKKGVLLADCLRSIYVDRPFVIYLGLGPEWSASPAGKEYIDREAEAERNMYRFSVLLQQGTSRIYAVNSMRNGKESVPSPVFEQIREYQHGSDAGSDLSKFKNICGTLIRGRWTAPPEKDVAASRDGLTDTPNKEDWKFSKTAYNNYYACPRAYMYGRLITIPDSEQTMFGNIIHEFAEFYLCYPELVKGRTEQYMEAIREKYSGLSSRQMEGIDWSRIRVCMANIIRFIDSLDVKEIPLDRDYSKREHKNMFMDMHRCTAYSSMTETRFDSRTHPLYGNFDLVLGNRIIDYKTGKASSPKDIKKRMSLDTKQKYYEFQPMVYLSLLRDNSPPPHRFSLFYVADNDVRSVTEEGFSIGENIREVVLIRENMREYLSDPDSPVKADLTAARYSRITERWSTFADCAFDAGSEDCASWKDDAGLASKIMDALAMNDNKTNRDAVHGALKTLSGVISDGMHIDGGVIIIPSDTLERFLSCVDGHHVLASAQMHSEFPASPRNGCADCDFFKACTKDVIDLDGGDDDE